MALIIAAAVVVWRRHVAPKRLADTRLGLRGEALAEDSEVPPPFSPALSFLDPVGP